MTQLLLSILVSVWLILILSSPSPPMFYQSERALQHWRTTVSPKLSQLPLIGRVIDWFWPTPTRQPLHSGADGLGGSIDFLARSFGAGLLLPFAAFVVGRVCFQSTKNSYKRVVLVNFITKVFDYPCPGTFTNNYACKLDVHCLVFMKCHRQYIEGGKVGEWVRWEEDKTEKTEQKD